MGALDPTFARHEPANANRPLRAPRVRGLWFPVHTWLGRASACVGVQEMYAPEGPFLSVEDVVQDAMDALLDQTSEIRSCAFVAYRAHPGLADGEQPVSVMDAMPEVARALRERIERWEDRNEADFPWVPRCVLDLTSYREWGWRGAQRAASLAAYEADNAAKERGE